MITDQTLPETKKKIQTGLASLTETETLVCNVLQYYALFQYPLTAAEVYNNFPVRTTLSVVYNALQQLVEREIVHRKDKYYSLECNIAELVPRRLKANEKAGREIQNAEKKAAFIYRFPFVRFVGISGSLSKGYADEKSDYDFFIITERNRLWICRTLLHLFKKLTFLTGSQHNYCMNYFIDMHQLTLEEQNRFTSVELATILPVKGNGVFTSFIQANSWLYSYQPNHPSKFTLPYLPPDGKTAISIKKTAEWLLDLLAADKVNKLLMQLTDAKWKRKWAMRNYPAGDYSLAFKTTIHVSKNHAANYQKKILDRLPERFRYSM